MVNSTILVRPTPSLLRFCKKRMHFVSVNLYGSLATVEAIDDSAHFQESLASGVQYGWTSGIVMDDAVADVSKPDRCAVLRSGRAADPLVPEAEREPPAHKAHRSG